MRSQNESTTFLVTDPKNLTLIDATRENSPWWDGIWSLELFFLFFSDPKCSGPTTLLDPIFFLPRFCLDQTISKPIFWMHNISNQIFWHNIFNLKCFLTQHFVDPELFWRKSFLIQNLFGPKIVFRANYFWDLRFFWPKISCIQNLFGPK